MRTALVWFRRDLRLADHPALQAALSRYDAVIPVYIHAPDEDAPWSPGGASRWWLHHSLTALDADLRARGSRLLIRHGDSLPALLNLVRETGAEAVYWSRRYEPAAIARDTRIKSALTEQGLDAASFNSALLVEPWALRNKSGGPYKVFTPYWRAADAHWRSQTAGDLAAPRAVLPTPEKIPPPASLHTMASVALPELELLPRIAWDQGFYAQWTPGEAGAWAKLHRFIDVAADYKTRRDYPAEPATSGLSAHLAFGEISPLQICLYLESVLMQPGRAGLTDGIEHFIREIGWREFSHHLLYHFPHTPTTPLNERFAQFSWRANPADLAAWQRGRTGVPIVDAGMRELWQTGWMHNRVRMIVASFLTKNLLIPWQRGAEWFWDTLVDADLANNTQGWQWTAGCGADAAPYFRVFNPVLQSAKFDPDGTYIRRFVPELGKLKGNALYAPWTASSSELSRAGVQLGKTYPWPVVDLAESRGRALAAYAETGANPDDPAAADT